MDSNGYTLVEGYIYHINNENDKHSEIKEGGDYIYLGPDKVQLNDRHIFQPIDISGNFFTKSNNHLLYIPLKALSGRSPYTVTLKNRVAGGGRRKIRKETRKTRARRRNRRKHTRKH